MPLEAGHKWNKPLGTIRGRTDNDERREPFHRGPARVSREEGGHEVDKLGLLKTEGKEKKEAGQARPNSLHYLRRCPAKDPDRLSSSSTLSAGVKRNDITLGSSYPGQTT